MANITPWAWTKKNAPVRNEEHPAYSLQRELNRLFDEFLNTGDMPMGYIEQEFSNFVPKMEMKETDKEVVVSAELPGLEEKDVQVSIHNDVLTIAGEKKQEKEEKGNGYHRTERVYGSFHRSVAVPVDVDQNQIKAQFKNGVLTITLPKLPPSQSKSKVIPVNKAQ